MGGPGEASPPTQSLAYGPSRSWSQITLASIKGSVILVIPLPLLAVLVARRMPLVRVAPAVVWAGNWTGLNRNKLYRLWGPSLSLSPLGGFPSFSFFLALRCGRQPPQGDRWYGLPLSRVGFFGPAP